MLNPFLNALFYSPNPSSKLRDIRRALSSNPAGYTILAPSAKVLEWSVDQDSSQSLRTLSATDEFIGSHIINSPAPTTVNPSRAVYLDTFNGRTLVLTNGCVYTFKGFKKSFKVRVLSEYMISPLNEMDPDTALYVFEIDGSLIGTLMPSPEVSASIGPPYESKTTTTNSKLSFPPTLKNSSKTNEPRSPDDDKDLEDRPNFETVLDSCPPVARQIMGPIDLVLENFDVSSAPSRDEAAKILKNSVDLVAKVLQSADRSALMRSSLFKSLSGEDLADMLHEFVECNVYEKLWNQIILWNKDKDSNISQSLSKMAHVDISQMGLPSASRSELIRLDALANGAAVSLGKLSSSIGCEVKIAALLETIDLLSSSRVNGSSGESVNHNDKPKDNAEDAPAVNGTVNADTLVGLMVLVLCRSQISHPFSQLDYIRTFTYRNSSVGKIGYALMTYEAVLYHIEHEAHRLAALSDANMEVWKGAKKATAEQDFEKQLETFKKTFSDDEWRSIVMSRNQSGESALTIAARAGNVAALNVLLRLELVTPDYIVSEKTEDDTTVLMAAVESESRPVIERLLALIDTLPEQQRLQYYRQTDKWLRNVGHYLFHAPWLIERIGTMIPWTSKDINGQTPLFTLYRCYDHPHYHEMVETATDAYTQCSNTTDLLDHVDGRGNTLLHICKDVETMKRVLSFDTDVNWPNDKKLTPLMLFSKFSKIDQIMLLNKVETFDIERTDARGLTALEMSREVSTLNALDELFLMNRPEINGRVTSITRTAIAENEPFFVIKSWKPSDPSSATSVLRTYSDFMFLQKWLSYENPYSWIPIVPRPRKMKPLRQVIHALQLRFDMMIQLLLSHPTFSGHELLWEFLLIQDFSKSQCEQRSKRKLESNRESYNSDVVVYSKADLDVIQFFFEHAEQETGGLCEAIGSLTKCATQYHNRFSELSQTMGILGGCLRDLSFYDDICGPRFEREYHLSAGVYDNGTINLATNLTNIRNSSRTVVSYLSRPLGLIKHLENQQEELKQCHSQLERLNNKNGWPMGMFEEKREQNIRSTKKKIYNLQAEIHRLGTDIKQFHVTAASELGPFYNWQETQLRHTIREFTITTIKANKERLQRLQRLKGQVIE